MSVRNMRRDVGIATAFAGGAAVGASGGGGEGVTQPRRPTGRPPLAVALFGGLMLAMACVTVASGWPRRPAANLVGPHPGAGGGAPWGRSAGPARTAAPPTAAGDAAHRASGAIANPSFEEDSGADNAFVGKAAGVVSLEGGVVVHAIPGWLRGGEGELLLCPQGAAAYGRVTSGGGRRFAVLRWNGNGPAPTLRQSVRGLESGRRYTLSVSAARHRVQDTAVALIVDGTKLQQVTPLPRFRRVRAVFTAAAEHALVELRQHGAGALLLDDVRLEPAGPDDDPSDPGIAPQSREQREPPVTADVFAEDATWPLFGLPHVLALVTAAATAAAGADCGFSAAAAALRARHGWAIAAVSRDQPLGLALVTSCAAAGRVVAAAAEGLWPAAPAVVACVPAEEAVRCARVGALRVLTPRALPPGANETAAVVARAVADAAGAAVLRSAAGFSTSDANRSRGAAVSWALLAADAQQLRLEPLPEPGPTSWKPTDRWPDSCPGEPTRMYYAHARKREGELTPTEFYDAMRGLAAAGNSSVHSVVALDGTEIGPVLNALPLADAHGGRHDLFRPWELNSSCVRDSKGTQQCEAIHWSVQWKRNGAQAVGPPQLLPAQPPLWTAVIRDAWLNDGYVLSCDRAYDRGGCQWNMQRALAREAVDRAVILCDTWCNGYFHFLHEHLPRVAPVLEALRADSGMRVVLSGRQGRQTGLKPFVADFLVEVLGIPRGRIIVDTPVFARWTYLVQPQPCGNVFTAALHQLRKAVFRQLRLRHVADYPLRARSFVVLLAERRGTNQAAARMPRDWASAKRNLREVYADSGILLRVAPDDGHLADQVRAFQQADMVIGPHGANLANVVWMRHGTTVLEFMSYRYGNMCYYTTAARLGLRYRLLLHSALKGSSDYSAPLGELRAHIDDAAAAAKEPAGHVSSFEPT